MKLTVDPLAEKKYEVLPGLIWKYTNRILWLVTPECDSQCAFCFRKNLNQERKQTAGPKEVAEFVVKYPKIHEVIFSGGEPLLDMERIREVITLLSPLSQISQWRIHTRQPITFPKKVQLDQLKQIVELTDKPIYLVLHVNHPREIMMPETKQLVISMRKLGVILLSHTVFLAGINDSVEVLAQLFEELVELGVKPYSIFHCDTMAHTQQFVVPLEKEVEIMTTLRKQLTGIAYPLHILDSGSGKGKLPVPTNFWQHNLNEYCDFDETVLKS